MDFSTSSSVFLFVAAVASGEDVLYEASYPNVRYSPFTPIITAEGFVADTPEIAAAKIAHYAAYSQAVAASGASPDHVYQEYINTFRSTPAMYNVPAAPLTPTEEPQSKFVAASSFPNYQALQNPFLTPSLSKNEEPESKFVAASSFPNYQALQNPFLTPSLSKNEEPESKFVAASSFPNYQALQNPFLTPSLSKNEEPESKFVAASSFPNYQALQNPFLTPSLYKNDEAESKYVTASSFPNYQALQNPYSIPALYKTVNPNSVGSPVLPSDSLVPQAQVPGAPGDYSYADLRSTPAYNQNIDTPEVAAAKAAHYAAYIKALAASGTSGYTHQDYLDTLRSIPAPIVPSDTAVVDTPEVHAAKIAHQAAHAAAIAASEKPSEYRYREYQNFFNPPTAYRGNGNV
ncbi:uncharacterized protein LOC124360960 [Homalodisca vitripennis]|uniref:uncharacterized protein LOC124360960 n=1 Tax=Homalodisca vitripennis TaxID=197043 RepID=UPI001EEACE67|nr:uncharacterized protein LOC124360960 [Homalodisca vitripennis]